MTTTESLQEQALTAFTARRQREDAEQAAKIETGLQVLRERAGETLNDALEIRTEPSEWKLTDIDELYSSGRGTAVVHKLGLRFAYHERSYGHGGPPVELTVQHQCPRCDAWYDAEDLSLRTSSYPAIERLGRYYARLEEGELEHTYCPATSRCEDESCLRPEPHYGHAPNVEAAESAELFPINEEAPSPFEACPICGSATRMTLTADWQERVDAGEKVTIVGCGNPWHYDGLQPRPDEQLGNALRAWLEANVGARASAAGRAIHDEIERVVREGGDG